MKIIVFFLQKHQRFLSGLGFDEGVFIYIYLFVRKTNDTDLWRYVIFTPRGRTIAMKEIEENRCENGKRNEVKERHLCL